MDKYTYNLKADKIQKLVRQEDYVTAVKIADTMDWGQERNVRLLTSVAEAYEKTGQYQTAIDILLTACERATVRKRILYKLTELNIKNGSIEDAETFYKRYLEEAADENNRYILRYEIAEAKGEPLDKRITILETYRKHEFEEKWTCRLAELYQEGGREKECVALCDEIILWFGVGKYVDRAMELKETYQPLTESQKEHRENRAYYEEKVREVAKEMEEALERSPLEDEPEESPAAPESAEEKKAPVKEEEKPAESEPETEPAAEAAEEQPLPEIAISEEVAAAFEGGSADKEETGTENAEEKPEIAEPQPETAEPQPETAADSGPAPDEMFEEDPKGEPEDPERTKPLNLYDALRSPKLQGPEELAKTQEVVLPSHLREQPQVEHVVLETAEDAETPAPAEGSALPAEEEPEASAEETSAGESGAEETPVEAPAEETGAEETPVEAPAEEAPAEEVSAEKNAEPAETEDAAAPEEAEEEPLPLEKDANVLPVLSYEETEKAVWEDQNRRMEEQKPSESHEMEHCIFVSAANSAEGVNKAVEVLGEHYRKQNRELSAIAKITGEKLNRRGLVRSLPQLKKKDLIIDEAGKLDDAIIGEMLEIMEYLEPGKVFVLLETPAETEKLRQRVRTQIIEAEKAHGGSAPKQEQEEDQLPKIQLTQTGEAVKEAEKAKEEAVPVSGTSAPEQEEKKQEDRPSGKEGARRISFANLSEDQVLSEKDFLRYAEYFARELECSIDPSGMEALENECRLIRQEGGLLTVGEAEAVIEDAAEHAEKHTIKRLFAAKYDKEGYLILRKRNFA